jgi:type I restriction enzyme S subunit
MASGGTPKSLNKDYYSGDIKWFSTKELKDCFLFDSEKHISKDALNNSSAKLFPEGTILMAIYAAPTVGRLGILTNPATFNQAAVGIVPKENVGNEFLYLSLLSERINLNNLASGAAQQNLNVGIVKNYNILVPEQKILDVFNRIVKSIFTLLKKNANESRRLAELRDTLLPKLMSGELKVNEIEDIL